MPASALKYDEHFQETDLTIQDIDILKDFVRNFKNVDESRLQSSILMLKVDVDRSKNCLMACHAERELNERDTTFAYIDPLLKALNQLTGCVYYFEQPVSAADILMLKDVTGLKELQQQVSHRSRTDVSVYHLKIGKYQKLIIMEIKSDKTFSKDSIAQTIGYFLSSKAASTYVQMGLVISGSKACVLMFPFRDRGTIYSDAIVTAEINLNENEYYLNLLLNL